MRRIAVAVAVAASFVGLVPAHATSTKVRECAITGTMTFTPRLTSAIARGSLTYTYTPRCVVTYTNGVTGTQTYTWAITLDYFGSCATAVVTDPTNSTAVGYLIGGTTMVRGGVDPAVSSWAGAFTLVPAGFDPCDMGDAAVLSGSADVEPGTIP